MSLQMSGPALHACKGATEHVALLVPALQNLGCDTCTNSWHSTSQHSILNATGKPAIAEATHPPRPSRVQPPGCAPPH